MQKFTLTLASLLIVTSLLLAGCGVSTPEPFDQTQDRPALAETNVASAGQADESLSGVISVSGAFALYPMMTVWADEFHKLHPDFQFDVQGGGAGKGMTDTIAGAVDIGMISRTIKPEEEAQNIFWVSVTKDAVFPIISSENPVAEQILAKGISQEIFNKIYISGEITTWGEVVGDPSITDEINVFTRSDAAGAAEQWAKFAGGKAQEDLKGIGVNGEPSILDTVIKDPLGIGYGNLNSIFDLSSGNTVPGIIIPPIDIDKNGKADAIEIYKVKADAFNAVANGTYPSPPARFENLATLGKPQGLTLAFIKWILTDGQQYLESAGYVPLTPEQQAESLAKLK
jgi:phosphate transport system substrate-binding protein